MAKGICKGCKKFTELNASGYCNVNNTAQGACNARSLGMVAGDKLGEMLENWATQYVSKTTFKIILGCVFVAGVIIFQATHKYSH